MGAFKKETLEELELCERTLRRFCHNEECEEVDKCPRGPEHSQCSSLLGLHTAIVWALADEIRELRKRFNWEFDVWEYAHYVRQLTSFATKILALEGGNYRHELEVLEGLEEYLLELTYTLRGDHGLRRVKFLPMWCRQRKENNHDDDD